MSSPAASTFSAFRFAAFAAFGFILKTLVGKKHLLAGGKYKFSATLRTLQHPVVVFHEPLSLVPLGQGMGFGELFGPNNTGVPISRGSRAWIPWPA